MKNKIKILIIPVLALCLGSGKAAADDEALAAFGGFIGGVIATKVFDDHNRGKCEQVIYVERERCGKHSHKSKTFSRESCEKSCRPKPAGYYKTVRERIWVPGYWAYDRDRCGNRIRYWQSGYSKIVKKRVWVENRRSHGYDCGHGKPAYASSHHR